MSKILETFLEVSESKVFDAEYRKKIMHNIALYDKKVVEGKEQFSSIELAKTRVAAVKHKSIEKLEKYLIEFETNFTKRGGKVIWAQDAEEAVKEALKIMQKAKAKMVVKTKSMVSEEIHLKDDLEKNGIEGIETDLGEYIIQLRKESAFHTVTPAMHLSKEDIAKTFNEKKGTPLDSTPEQITDFVRKELREKYPKAEVGVSGANFLIADIGAIAITENEGNGLMSLAFPKVHIAIVGIEKIIPSIADLDLFWPMLPLVQTEHALIINLISNRPQ